MRQHKYGGMSNKEEVGRKKNGWIRYDKEYRRNYQEGRIKNETEEGNIRTTKEWIRTKKE